MLIRPVFNNGRVPGLVDMVKPFHSLDPPDGSNVKRAQVLFRVPGFRTAQEHRHALGLTLSCHTLSAC